jgi:hypothetical protein
MRRQGKIWLSATVLVLGAAACKFSDPTDSQRGGPSAVRITELGTNDGTYRPVLTAVGSVVHVDLAVAESVVVGVQVLDGQGNYLAFAVPTLGTASGTVAAMVNLPDSTAVPGGTLWKGLLIGNAAGTTTATVQAAGLSETITVRVQ